MLETWTQNELARLDGAGLLRDESVVTGPLHPRFELDGMEVLSLSSNSYLGLASDPRLISALQEGAERWGVGASASRLVGGTHRAHRQCERALSEYVQAPDALLFTSGYAANLGVISSLMHEGDLIFSDALNHASIIDGCRLSRAKTIVYAHRDTDDLRTKLEQCKHHEGRRLIVTDALFSMDGHLAPLQALRELANEFRADLMVDEAHSLGVLGPKGRGACAASGVKADVLIGTLGKAFGVCGAFAAASHSIIDLMKNRARSYVFSTAPPPALAETILVSIGLVREADDRRTQLLQHASRLRTGLTEKGFAVPPIDGAIVPLILHTPERTMRASELLLREGVYARGIRPPTVPTNTARLRLVPIATHTEAEIEDALQLIITAAEKVAS